MLAERTRGGSALIRSTETDVRRPNIALQASNLRMLFAAPVVVAAVILFPQLRKATVAIAAFVTLLLAIPAIAVTPDEARVTRIIHDVRLLPTGAKAKPATINDQVDADTGVRTGDRSRSELTFTDLTIERLGANTVFHFDNAGRSVQLDGGSMLLRVPKNSGGAQMQTRAVTVGISGTTVILDTTSAGRNKLIVLEGAAQLSLRRYPRESVNVRGGQMEDVPPGATKLPPPVPIDLNDVMKHHPLITDFKPLPSQDLIYSTMRDEPIAGQPVNGGPAAVIPPIIGNILGGGTIAIGPGRGGGRGHIPSGRGSRNPNRNDGRTTGGKSKPLRDVSSNNRSSRRASPTPTPARKPKTG
jgi:FecR protein